MIERFNTSRVVTDILQKSYIYQYRYLKIIDYFFSDLSEIVLIIKIIKSSKNAFTKNMHGKH